VKKGSSLTFLFSVDFRDQFLINGADGLGRGDG
jgi:hypothetical protein